MPEKGKRQLQAEQTKDKLFFAAEALLAEKDYEDITIRDIIARAEVSIGTFYHYFPTKLDVFYETYRLADQYFTDVVAPQLDQPTAYERILAFFDHYAHYSSDQTNPQLTYLLYNAKNPHFNRDPRHGMSGVLIDVVQQGLDSGEIVSSDSAEQITTFLMVTLRGLVYNWATMQRSYDLPRTMHWYLERLLKAYFA